MAEMYGVAAALFDLDNTLLDSAGLWRRIDAAYLSRRGLTATPEYAAAIAAMSMRAAAEYSIALFKLDDAPEALMAEWTNMAKNAYEREIRLLDGAAEYVDRCARSGIRIAAVTSLRRELAEPCLENNRILEYFENLFTSDEIGHNKSSPEIYKHAANVMGVTPRGCVVFDDTAAAISSAKAAGMRTVAVGEHCGFSGADRTVKSLRDAPTLLSDKLR